MIVNKRSIYVTGAVIDFVLINLSFLLAVLVSKQTDLSFGRIHPYLMLPILNFVWFFYTSSSGFYQEFLIRPFPIQLYNIFKLAIIISVVNVLLLFLIKQQLFTRNFIIINGMLIMITITTRTIIYKSALRALRNKGRSIRNLLIIGATEVGEKFREVIGKNPEFGHRFVGYINNNPRQDVIGSFSELDKILKEKNVEDVVIALHNELSGNLDELVRICNRNAVKVHFIPDYFKFLSGRFQIRYC